MPFNIFFVYQYQSHRGEFGGNKNKLELFLISLSWKWVKKGSQIVLILYSHWSDIFNTINCKETEWIIDAYFSRKEKNSGKCELVTVYRMRKQTNNLIFYNMLLRQNSVAETKIFTKFLQYTRSDWSLRRVVATCCCRCVPNTRVIIFNYDCRYFLWLLMSRRDQSEQGKFPKIF